jgi:hypothetical protein
LIPKNRTPDCLIYADRQCRERGPDENNLFASPADSDPSSMHPRLFLLGGVPDWGDGSPRKLGLAPSGTRIGDYICTVHGIDKAIVVRKDEGMVRVMELQPLPKIDLWLELLKTIT